MTQRAAATDSASCCNQPLQAIADCSKPASPLQEAAPGTPCAQRQPAAAGALAFRIGDALVACPQMLEGLYSRRQQRAQHINGEAVVHIIFLQTLHSSVHVVHVNYLHASHMWR